MYSRIFRCVAFAESTFPVMDFAFGTQCSRAEMSQGLNLSIEMLLGTPPITSSYRMKSRPPSNFVRKLASLLCDLAVSTCIQPSLSFGVSTLSPQQIFHGSLKCWASGFGAPSVKRLGVTKNKRYNYTLRIYWWHNRGFVFLFHECWLWKERCICL